MDEGKLEEAKTKSPKKKRKRSTIKEEFPVEEAPEKFPESRETLENGQESDNAQAEQASSPSTHAQVVTVKTRFNPFQSLLNDPDE